MSYAVKNSLVLGILLLLIGGAGSVYVFFIQTRQVKAIESERKKIQAELGDVNELLGRLESVKQRVRVLDAAWALRPKTLPTFEDASATNVYLNNILAMSADMDLNVLTQEQVPQEGCGYLRYRLAGQGSFESFVRFVQFLEYGPRLMKLRNVDIREVHTLDEKVGVVVHTVQFDADLLAYYSEQQLFADSSNAGYVQQTTIPGVNGNPFQSLVVPLIPPNVYGLLDVEKSSLLAVMNDRAFVNDQSGQMVMVTEKDEVYLGYCSKIMPERKQVEFILNKGGMIERYVMTLKMNTKLDVSP